MTMLGSCQGRFMPREGSSQGQFMPRLGLCQVKARVSVGFTQKSGQRQGKFMQILRIGVNMIKLKL